MVVILYIVIILLWLMLIYIPLVCLAGVIASCISGNATTVMHNPYFGLVNVSPNKGILIWSIRLVLLGAVLCLYSEWYRKGLNPFIPL